MIHYFSKFILCLILVCCSFFANSQQINLQKYLANPPKSAKPWVFWYWVNGCVSKDGIKADIEAMKQVGIGGAYLMFIKDTTTKIDFQPQIRQLTPEWYAMVRYAMQEAKRLKLQIGLHFSDGFALAGGPWIKPEQSMQKLVWTKAIYKPQFKNEKLFLQQPETNEGFYKDIKTYAYRLNYKPSYANLISVTDNIGVNLFYLTQKDSSKTYRSDSTCTINFKYDKAFTLRQVHIKKQNNAYQAQRFIIQASKDGINYFTVDTLVPPRHGWQDNSFGYTHSVKNTTSQYFRLLWQKEGTAPGSEELDAAKWKPVLRVQGIYLSEEPTINNIEAKNGSVWRKANATTADEVTNTTIVQPSDIIDVTKFMTGNVLRWQPNDDADYRIVRIGHTSTRQQNETGGGGKGLECDKLNANSVTLQYNNWFHTIFQKTNAKDVVNTLHIDSWECGSQNWTADFLQQFKKIHKYDLDKFLLAATGTPIASVEKSEKVLLDYRNTIATLMNERFFGTIKKEAKKNNLQISAESTAPTFVADGLAHYKNVDMPMGEFWLNSPTHDKPTDMADAINAAHIYGKNIVGAEAFTTLRMDWSESPQTLKAIGDRAFANGINKMIIHVMVHNPWMNKKPGMTLDGIGLYYQRDQPWFEQSKAWIDYLTRTSALLQLGKPVVDVAVYVGNDNPVRSFLPHQLVNDFPNLFSKEFVEKDKLRVANMGQPLTTIPDGVTHTANTLKAPLMLNAMGNYKYDCINTEILNQLKVVNGKLVTPTGAVYKALLLPKTIVGNVFSGKINSLRKEGAIIINDSNQPIVPSICSVKITDENIVYSKRSINGFNFYFFSNQENIAKSVSIEIITEKKYLNEVFLSGGQNYNTSVSNNKFSFVVEFKPFESKLFLETNEEPEIHASNSFVGYNKKILDWSLYFKNIDKVKIVKNGILDSWANETDKDLKYYSGTVIYTTKIKFDEPDFRRSFLEIEKLEGIATIRVNGKEVNTLWANLYMQYIGQYLQEGENTIEIEVANTWHNALIGNELHKDLKQKTFTNAPFRLKDKPLLPAGIIGTVKIVY